MSVLFRPYISRETSETIQERNYMQLYTAPLCYDDIAPCYSFYTELYTFDLPSTMISPFTFLCAKSLLGVSRLSAVQRKLITLRIKSKI